MDESTVDVAGDKSKGRRRGRREAGPGGDAHSGRPTTEQRLPLGAPIVRAPVRPKPSAPVNLKPGDVDAPGIPGGRRSRAYPAQVQPEPEVRATQLRPLTVVDGDDAGFDAEEDAVRTLSPSSATALGDFAAAMAGPIAAAIYIHSIAVFIATALLVLLARSQGRRSALSEGEVAGLSPVIAGVGAAGMSLAVDPAAGAAEAAIAGLVALGAGSLAAITVKLVADRFVHVRIAVLGEAAAAHKLAWQLSSAGVKRYTVTGYVTRTTERDNLRDLDHISFKVRRLGVIGDLSHIVARNDIDLLVMASDEDRLKTFERATVCTERYRTKLLSLTAFEEVVFRRVPIEQLNVAWFQHIMHPRFRPAPRAITRAIDVAFAVVAGIITLPVWALTAAFMRVAFGRPVIMHRRRVGERGRSFSILLFRVARRDITGAPPDEDAPAVGFGKFLRTTRIERLPLLVNVLRGDLSLVGPRPTRPQRASEVEREIPFYSRRNLVRPGLIGWAQLHEPALKDPGKQLDARTELSHDLFYVKHQSLMLYGFVIFATVWRGFTGKQRPVRG